MKSHFLHRARKSTLGVVIILLAGICSNSVLAQSTAAPVVTGYLSTSGCSYGQTTCFVQYGASGGGGSYNGPLAAQLPASLGAKTSANSLSVTPGTDAVFSVQGNSASGASDSGFPVKVGGVFNTTPPTLTTGQRGDFQVDASGNLKILPQIGTLPLATASAVADGSSNSVGGVLSRGFGLYFNSLSWDRQRSIQGADGTGIGVSAVSTSPNSSANSAVSPATTATSTNALKGSAGNAFSVSVTNGTTAGCLILYDSATTPTSGTALTTASIKFHALVAASVSYNQDFLWPKAFSAGIQLLFSTTCTTYTTPGTLPVLLTGEAK